MLNIILQKCNWLLCLYVLLIFTGCAATPIQFNNNAPDKAITLLPIVDLREKKKANTAKIQQYLKRRVAFRLLEKGYEVIISDSLTENITFIPENILEMSADELSEFGPDKSRNILILVLSDSSTTNLVIAKSSNLKMSAILIDKHNACFLLNEKIKGGSFSGIENLGLIAQLAETDLGAVDNCILRFMQMLPTTLPSCESS